MKDKTLYNKLDKMWRELIYHYAGYKCEYCGESGRLNAHHIFSRSNSAVRWELKNGVCVCVSHHVFGNLSFHKAPAEMIEWIKGERGEEWYNSLRDLANRNVKKRMIAEEYYDILKPLYEEIKEE